jgi:hypothetical protein
MNPGFRHGGELTLQDIKQLVEVEKSPHHSQRDSRSAFDNAISQGLDPDAFMYMYSMTAQAPTGGYIRRDFFKHADTREYVSYRDLSLPPGGGLYG